MLQNRFTECGGLLVRRLVRVLMDAMGSTSCDELKTIELMSILVSVPINVVDVDAICQNARVQLPPEQVQAILQFTDCLICLLKLPTLPTNNVNDLHLSICSLLNNINAH